MSIKVRCPNGHLLSVSDRFAGKSGLCPACKARVQVPQARAAAVSEDAILNILKSRSPGPAQYVAPPAPMEPVKEPAMEPAKEPHKADRMALPKKTCYKCQQEILATAHICPLCHTYIANLADF